MSQPVVSILMGSDSDLNIMKEASDVLNSMQIPNEMKILSAHRAPDALADYLKNAMRKGTKVIIAGAGGAAHLAGVCAAHFPLPVIGVPIKSSNSIDGWDSILSTLQMPSGVPVATVAVNGAKNAGILAVQILATSDKNLQKRLTKFKEELKNSVLEKNKKLNL